MRKKLIQVIGTLLFAFTMRHSLGAPIPVSESHLLININPGWRFQPGNPPGDPTESDYDDSNWDIVSLPHSHEIFSANLDGFREKGREVGWYRRQLVAPREWLDRKVFIEFQGAMETTKVWLNGKAVGSYAVSGFDSFDFDLTPFLQSGTNLLAVQVDNRVNPNIPPDGEPMDYILFGGLYRDAFLHVTDSMHVTFPWEAREAGVRITLPKVSEESANIAVETTVRNESPCARQCQLTTEISDRDGKIVASAQDQHDIQSGQEFTFNQNVSSIANPHLWSPDDPYLYKAVTHVLEGNREIDRVKTPMGIRWVKFDKEKGFFLNGKHLKLVGVNCHQTWPFIGGAVPDGLHRRDAEQIKAMGVNWVRLSHYPQSPEFLDALDELGLMALEEPPTWAKPGNQEWMTNLESSFRSMIRRDRNHPSVIIWGACINHETKNPALVEAALEEDPGRDRGQDTVATPMNFQPFQISGNGALSIEHTGHTFPTQRGARTTLTRVRVGGQNRLQKDINREFDQAERHWEQVNAAYEKEDNSGLAVWCMYDYNTFHNTDEAGMVWHGVCDLFRIPKYTYWWHMSELTSKPMAYLVRVDDRQVAVFSNCEKVRLLENDGDGYREVATHSPEINFMSPAGRQIPFALHHPPFRFTIAANAVDLKAEGLMDNVTVATSEVRNPGSPVSLKLEADRPTIVADGADITRLVVTAIDSNGTAIDTCNTLVKFNLQGAGQLLGDNPVHLRAGRMIILAQSGFVPGKLDIEATANGLLSAKIPVKMDAAQSDEDIPTDLRVAQPTKRISVDNGVSLSGK